MNRTDTQDAASPLRCVMRQLRGFILVAAAISSAGCATLRPIDGTSTELRQRLGAGELLKAGNRVSIVTTDHKRHQFVVTGIDAGRIEGRTDSVPEDEAVSLRKRQVSRGETLALVGGVVLGAGLVVFAAAQVTLAGIFARMN